MKGMECVMCEETITNPICPACIQSGVQQWLLEEGQGDLLADIRELTRTIFANHGETFCIKCDNLMALCDRCYLRKVFELFTPHSALADQYVMYFGIENIQSPEILPLIEGFQ